MNTANGSAAPRRVTASIAGTLALVLGAGLVVASAVPPQAAAQVQPPMQRAVPGTRVVPRMARPAAARHPGAPTAGGGRCAPIGVTRTDLDRRMRERICTRALTDDPNGYCGGTVGR